ncbi:MAG: tRNA (guanosine(37)-N1)-methyltransferase TrmD [FCB group bacterium]|nr:tRNA (guanosine(37)-N1)-methyltransferase TrmD [FCB group bacterium]
MKRFVVITPVPQIIDSIVTNSILRQAVEKGLAEFHTINLRDFGEGNYRQIDDEPFGGGPGMVLMAEPLFAAVDAALKWLDGKGQIRYVFPSPQGQVWTYATTRREMTGENFIFLCGHYKGIDERVLDALRPVEYSLGDFVVSGGELPTMIMIDSMVRLIPGVLNDLDSALTDSHVTELLDAPWYTRPRTVKGQEVPEVLLSGHHQKIEEWHRKQREQRTRERRPDLWKKYQQQKNSNE